MSLAQPLFISRDSYSLLAGLGDPVTRNDIALTLGTSRRNEPHAGFIKDHWNSPGEPLSPQGKSKLLLYLLTIKCYILQFELTLSTYIQDVHVIMFVILSFTSMLAAELSWQEPQVTADPKIPMDIWGHFFNSLSTHKAHEELKSFWTRTPGRVFRFVLVFFLSPWNKTFWVPCLSLHCSHSVLSVRGLAGQSPLFSCMSQRTHE